MRETKGTERTEETETVWQTDGRVRKGTLQCQQGDHEVEIEVCVRACVCGDIIQACVLAVDGEEGGRRGGTVPVRVWYTTEVQNTQVESWDGVKRACLRELKGVDPVLEGGGEG